MNRLHSIIIGDTPISTSPHSKGYFSRLSNTRQVRMRTPRTERSFQRAVFRIMTVIRFVDRMKIWIVGVQ
ncbi:hypothetical protein [Paenibacillus antibioticophila]|uniref:hypothetical protein n=1 Tax=Paenibacillus antibioticophila TaxID=1274374 RepID=UPI0011DD825D|nr:hypothetical protein [Paenibacillus antibioticophila]